MVRRDIAQWNFFLLTLKYVFKRRGSAELKGIVAYFANTYLDENV